MRPPLPPKFALKRRKATLLTSLTSTAVSFAWLVISSSPRGIFSSAHARSSSCSRAARCLGGVARIRSAAMRSTSLCMAANRATSLAGFSGSRRSSEWQGSAAPAGQERRCAIILSCSRSPTPGGRIGARARPARRVQTRHGPYCTMQFAQIDSF